MRERQTEILIGLARPAGSKRQHRNRMEDWFGDRKGALLPKPRLDQVNRPDDHNQDQRHEQVPGERVTVESLREI